jgi:Tol biopolymer transport system component
VNDHDVTAVLERLMAPIEHEVGSWDDVLERAGESRRTPDDSRRRRRGPFVTRRAVAVAVFILLLGVLLVTPAVGVGDRLLDLIERAPLTGGDMAHDVRDPVWSPDGRRIVFKRLLNDTFLLSIMNADGSGQRALQPRASDGSPAWSPDGRTLAVIGYRDGSAPQQPPQHIQLYIVDADGGGLRLLARNAREGTPAWSPDGTKIAFVRLHAGVDDVYVTNVDGTGVRRLARGVRVTSDDYIGPLPVPAWSPDGRSIAFISNRSGRSEIYVMNADGSGQRRLTRAAATEFGPVWSPDGSMIAFRRQRGDDWHYHDDIFVINADGTGLRRLTHNAVDDSDPIWSPDGLRIFFQSQRDGDDEIYVMNADGSGQRNLTRNPAYDSGLSLSPDGREIAFVSTRDGFQEVFVMNADGTDQRKLTQVIR